MKTTPNATTSVYLHRNKINGKVYVGITSDVRRRWRGDGLYYKGNEHFYRAIQKYGWSNFEHAVLFEGLTRDEACEKEVELIALYNATDPNFGYNKSAGGEKTTLGLKFSEYTKRLIGKKAKERLSSPEKHPMFGKHFSKESRAKMSKAHKGKVLTEEHRAHISKAQRGKFAGAENPMAKKVICLDCGTVFDTLTAAGEFAGVSRVAIQRCCKGLSKSAGGKHWSYYDTEEVAEA